MSEELEFEDGGVTGGQAGTVESARPHKERLSGKALSDPVLPQSSLVIVNPLLNTLIVICALVAFVAWYKDSPLPHAHQIDSELLRAPIQEEIDEARYRFQWSGSTYIVEPLASYDLAGLVVSHNNVGGITDAYHNSDAVDLKDLCVLWGENLLNDNFHKFEYSSDPWTCWLKSKEGAHYKEFHLEALGNNHLLAADASVAAQIREVRVGDQIRLRGQLINYREVGGQWSERKTSLTRDDRGNGACEVVMVKQIEILRRSPSVWGGVQRWSLYVLASLAVLKLATFLFMPLQFYRRFGS